MIESNCLRERRDCIHPIDMYALADIYFPRRRPQVENKLL